MIGRQRLEGDFQVIGGGQWAHRNLKKGYDWMKASQFMTFRI
jgi:hypothetical protein